jgi:glycosyltransferase involved in cell wall biosynthesis
MSQAQPAAAKLPISVVLPVLNEEENLPDALRSVALADEVIVIDSHSRDRTAEIARDAGAQLVEFDFRPGGPKKKAWALRTLSFRNPWVLLIDADERVPPALWREIEAAIGAADAADGYYVDRELVFMGRPMRSFRPNWNLRLFRRGRARIEDLALADLPHTGDNEIHEHVSVDGRVRYLRTPLLHNDYRGLTAWLDRHNKYATWEAHLYDRFRREPLPAGPLELLRLDPFRRKRLLRRVWVRLPFRPGLRFAVWYFGRRGFLDGRPGFIFCVLMSYYEFIIGAKLRELEQGRTS